MRMDIARRAIDNPIHTWLLVLACLLGGWWGISTIGRLEDPAFTIRIAVVATQYPGATAEEVEREVTEVLESAIQQMPQLDIVRSRSRPGVSEIDVELRSTLPSTAIAQAWNELRSRVGDAQAQLPSGAGRPSVNDDFGDVFGLYYAITAPGFDEREQREIARLMRRELLTVPGVADVEVAGLVAEEILVEVTQERLARLGIPLDAVVQAIQNENAVASAGRTQVGERDLRLALRPSLDTVAALQRIRIGRAGTTEQIALLDLATVSRQPVRHPPRIVAFNGQPAFTLGVSAIADTNIVDVGQAVAARLEAMAPYIPLGVELHPIYQQHEVVDEAINDFILNLAVSVAIVVGVLCLFMGWRVGLVVGGTLFLTVAGTVFGMRIMGLEMERISLGALIIAMGMLVDNAVVVAEGMLINMQRGRPARDAAADAAGRTQMPLLGATVIGILAFAGIGLSPDQTGEFLFSLFAVIAMSLLLSWLLAVTVTPLFGHYLLKAGKEEATDPYAGRTYRIYRGLLVGTLRLRWLTMAMLVLLTGASVWAFGMVRQGFFPDSNTPIFLVDFQLPQGTDIRATDAAMAPIDRMILETEGVVSVARFVGQGASRFMLTYQGERANPGYGQFIIRAESLEAITRMEGNLARRIAATHPDAQVRVQRLVFGPGAEARIAARFSGPDADVLRALAAEAIARLEADGRITDLRHDWHARELVAVPRLEEERMRVAGVARTDIAQALLFATSGVRAGEYREGDTIIPILTRAPEAERGDMGQLQDRLVWSPAEQAHVPLSQLMTRLETVQEDTLIQRRNRVRTLTVQANPGPGETAADAFARIRGGIEAIPLPPGYALEWGGEFENSQRAQEALGAQLPFSFIPMLVISILLFGRLRQPMIVWAVVPMAICGVALGLLATGMPFTFTALLGLLSLSGMLMKNAIVLVDEIDTRIAEGEALSEAITDGAVSRLRPVFLAAATTILGMVPLLGDAFFASMAVTIMAGLAFASLLTLFAVPALYAILFAAPAPGRAPAAAAT